MLGIFLFFNSRSWIILWDLCLLAASESNKVGIDHRKNIIDICQYGVSL